MSSTLKVLLSAYACEPDKGSEPEVGLRALLAAASQHDVWVITRENNLEPLRHFLADQPVSQRIHLIGLEVHGLAQRFKKKLGLLGMHWYYDTWQREAARRALDLDREVGFDLVHHVTFASYWTRAGVAAVPKPFVWGPVGGGVDPAWGLVTDLGTKGVAEDLLRVVIRRVVGARTSRQTQGRAAVVLAQNPMTAQRLRHVTGRIRILPNASVASPHFPISVRSRGTDVVFGGRLVPLKGAALALRAMRYVTLKPAELRIFGEGPEQRRLQRLAIRWGVDARVRFEGRVHRQRFIESVAGAAVLVHPAIHDEAGFAVAEALSVGTPVVCLDHGGPAELVTRWPKSLSRTVVPSTPTRTARQLGLAIEEFLRDPPSVPTAVVPAQPAFEDELLDAYELATSSRRLPQASKGDMRPLLVSVVIPAHNAERFIDQAVKSVLSQSHRLLEVVVVDDGSTDKTLTVLAGIDDPRLRVLSGPNRGVAHARNRGIQATTGPILAFLDADDYWFPNKIRTQLGVFETSEVDVVGCQMRYESAAGDSLGIAGERVRPSDTTRIADARFVPFPISSALMTRGLLEKLDGFDEDLDHIEGLVQDLDLLARIASIGGRFLLVPDTLGAYRIHDDAASVLHFESQRTGARFVRARTHARQNGEDLAWQDFMATYRPTVRQRYEDRVHAWYRSGGLNIASRHYAKGFLLVAMALTADPVYTVRRLARQQARAPR